MQEFYYSFAIVQQQNTPLTRKSNKNNDSIGKERALQPTNWAKRHYGLKVPAESRFLPLNNETHCNHTFITATACALYRQPGIHSLCSR